MLLIACLASAQAAEPASLAVELVDASGAVLRPAKAGEELPREARVRFVVRAPEGSYLHLLQRNERGVRSVYPGTSLVWVGHEGTEAVVPTSPNVGDEAPTGYNSEDDGPAEYILVRSPVPRAHPADGWLADLETFLAGPPYVTGPAAGRGEVIATFSIAWGPPVLDPTEPRVGDDEP